METTFKNEVALVSCGTFGVGAVTALAFANKGAKIVIEDWVENEETLNLIKDSGGEAFFVKCDV